MQASLSFFVFGIVCKSLLFILLVIIYFKSTTKLKRVCEVVVTEVIAKGILVSCKEERSSGFGKTEVQVERESH